MRSRTGRARAAQPGGGEAVRPLLHRQQRGDAVRRHRHPAGRPRRRSAGARPVLWRVPDVPSARRERRVVAPLPALWRPPPPGRPGADRPGRIRVSRQPLPRHPVQGRRRPVPHPQHRLPGTAAAVRGRQRRRRGHRQADQRLPEVATRPHLAQRGAGVPGSPVPRVLPGEGAPGGRGRAAHLRVRREVLLRGPGPAPRRQAVRATGHRKCAREHRLPPPARVRLARLRRPPGIAARSTSWRRARRRPCTCRSPIS